MNIHFSACQRISSLSTENPKIFIFKLPLELYNRFTCVRTSFYQYISIGPTYTSFVSTPPFVC